MFDDCGVNLGRSQFTTSISSSVTGKKRERDLSIFWYNEYADFFYKKNGRLYK